MTPPPLSPTHINAPLSAPSDRCPPRRYFLDRGADSFFDAIVAAKKTLAIQENADGGDDFEDDETDSAVMCYNLAGPWLRLWLRL